MSNLRRNLRGSRGRVQSNVASVAPFLPTSLPGLALWLRSDLGITQSGGSVTGWADQSGHAYNLVGHGTAAITYQGSGTASAATITVSEAVAAGDTLVVLFISTATTAPTDNASGGSNAYTSINTSLGATNVVCYGVISSKAAAGGSLVITPPATTSFVAYAHYQGAGSFDSATSANLGGSSVPNPGNVTPAGAGETIVAGSFTFGTSQTAGASYALRQAGSSTTLAIQDQIGAGAGSTATAFGTSATSWSAVAVTLIPAANPPVYAASDAAYNNRPSLGFTAAQAQYLVAAGSLGLSQPNTWYIVGQEASSVGGFVDGATSAIYGDGVGPNLGLYAGNTDAGTASVTSPCIVCAVFSGGNGTGYVNSSSSANPTSSACGAAGWGTVRIGGNGGITNYMSGKVLEVAAYNTTHILSQRQPMVAYLSSRYAIPAS